MPDPYDLCLGNDMPDSYDLRLGDDMPDSYTDRRGGACPARMCSVRADRYLGQPFFII